MVSRIPNDIFQFSLPSALSTTQESPLNITGPPSSALIGYGTHGIGTFAASSSSLLYLDGLGHQILASGKAQPAPMDAMLPTVMVTKFAPEFSAQIVNGRLGDGELVEWMGRHSGQGQSGGRNSYMPFLITGRFSSVMAQDPSVDVLEDVAGTIFGFSVPGWAKVVSGEGLQCVFITDGEEVERKGARVKSFVADEVVVEWAVTGRFHLGMPRGEEWERLELGG